MFFPRYSYSTSSLQVQLLYYRYSRPSIAPIYYYVRVSTSITSSLYYSYSISLLQYPTFPRSIDYIIPTYSRASTSIQQIYKSSPYSIYSISSSSIGSNRQYIAPTYPYASTSIQQLYKSSPYITGQPSYPLYSYITLRPLLSQY